MTEFQKLVQALVNHAPGLTPGRLIVHATHLARKMRRLALKSKRYAEAVCSRPTTRREESDNVTRDARFFKICKDIGCKARISGDPRGFVYAIVFPDGYHNSWGGPENGYGIG